ncbi:MAG TPA: universal stress protein [Gaiellaceae bacterium]|nr:universal stress protein [Gaiellaceae bacterium]
MNHVLVIANETVAGQTLIEALKSRAAEGETRVTVVAPINEPREGYVVYEDTRRAAAGRRLDRTLQLLREAGIPASGLVVDADPVNATRDAIAQAEPPIDSVIVSTHPPERSGWMQRNVPERVRKAAGSVPVEHVVVDMQAEGGPVNVLVVANETVVGERLLDWIRERARRSPASFLIVSPQSDPSVSAHPQAERRLRRALTILRGEGLDAHGQVAHPDPYSAAMHAVRDERVDEILVSTFPEARGSSWLRRDLIGRLRKDAGVPVEHIEITPEEVSVAS